MLMQQQQQQAVLPFDYHQASFLSGATAGAVSTCLANPFEALKTRMAGDKNAVGAADRRLSTHIRLMFKDGFLSGCRVGLVANLITSIPSNGVYLPTYNFAKESFVKNYGYHPTLTPFCAAVVAVSTTNALLSPFFMIRTTVQLNEQLTMRTAAKTIFRDNGMKGFYRGALTNTGGRIVEEALFWLAFENMKVAIGEHNTTLKAPAGDGGQHSLLWSVASVLSLSMAAKLFGTSVAFPYQTVMTHLRSKDKISGVHHHTKFLPTVAYVYKEGGIAGFYKGLVPNTIRSLISKSSQVLVFEYCIQTYCKLNHVERPKNS